MIDANDEVRFSDYTIMGPLPEDSDAFIAINALKNSVAMIEHETVDAIRRGIRMDDPLYSKELEELAGSAIIVPKQKNELYELRYQITHDIAPKESSFIFDILPTMNCNLSCPYCYAWRHQGETMSEETGNKVIEWIKRNIDPSKYKSASVSFCGGEPTLTPSIILAFVRDISAHCKEIGVQFETSMITNGLRFTAAFAKEVMDNNATPGRFQIQITLDGPEPVHNSRRGARDGSNSYATILHNLRELAGLEPQYRNQLEIHLRINVDRQNVDSLMGLAEQIHPLMAPDGIVSNVTACPTTIGCSPHDEFVLSRQEWLELMPPLWYRIADAYDIDISQQRNMSPCMEIKESGLVIGPDGSFYTCQAFGGNPEFAVGNIDSGLDASKYNEHYGLMPWSECIGKCPIVTWCWGICRGIAYNTLGDWRAKLCLQAEIIEDGLVYHRFKHRDIIATWLYNRANGLEDTEESYYREIAVSRA